MRKQLTISRRIKNILIAFDQFVWVLITLGAGYPDETISSATYRYEKKGQLLAKIARPVIDGLFWFKFKITLFKVIIGKAKDALPFSFLEYRLAMSVDL